MARLFAITPTHDDFAQAVLSDIRAVIYDAAVLLAADTGRPYALMAPMNAEQASSARSLSFGRKQAFYSEGDFSGALARDPSQFQRTRLFVGKYSDGVKLATGSLDSCAFFGIHYVSSRVWTEKLDGEYKMTLTAKFKKLSSDPLAPAHIETRDHLRNKSIYVRCFGL